MVEVMDIGPLVIYESESIKFKAYIVDDDGDAISSTNGSANVQVADMDVTVYDESVDSSTFIYQETGIDVTGGTSTNWQANIIVDTPSTTGWGKGAPGWNMDFVMTNTELETGTSTAIGGHRLRIEIALNLSSGDDIMLKAYVDVKGLQSK